MMKKVIRAQVAHKCFYQVDVEVDDGRSDASVESAIKKQAMREFGDADEIEVIEFMEVDIC